MTAALSVALQQLAVIPRAVLMASVRCYRLAVSPALPASCRFEPTCSAYALAALERHGAAAGSYLAVRRVLRCGPWCDGGHDPVPLNPPSLFRRVAAKASAPSSSNRLTPP